MLSTSWIESGKDFLYYCEGISMTIGRFIEGVDQEMLAIGKAIGLEFGSELIDVFTQYRVEYHKPEPCQPGVAGFVCSANQLLCRDGA